jgi:hypothetical protein
MCPSRPNQTGRRLALQRLAALSAASLLPWSRRPKHRHRLDAERPAAHGIGDRQQPLQGCAAEEPSQRRRRHRRNLKKLGFNVVSQLDADRIAMENAIRSYGEQLAKSRGVGLFYYAGHGLQVSWRNFLVPVDASLDRAMTSRARRSIWPPCSAASARQGTR